MEVLNPTIPSSQMFSKDSIFSSKTSFTTWRNRKQLKFNTPNSRIPLHPPFSLNLPLLNPKRFQISAQFSRPTNRRNSLRKKLTEQQQVRHGPVIYDTSSDFQNSVRKVDDIDNFQSNLDIDRVGKGISEFNSEEVEVIVESDALKKSKPKLHGDSTLLNQLESWVDQYKADSEFWGVGSGPIFTVVQKSDGKVEKVDVNEDEILRRRGLEPSLYKNREIGSFPEVSSKISHARYLATEIENGNNLLSTNSSVTKFVISGGESNFINAIQSVTLHRGLFYRLSRVGLAILCGFFMFWAMKRLFASGEEKCEYSRLEKEMMRRKMKARMEKEKLVKGSMEVIQASKEPEIMSTEKPSLDRQELNNSILKAKASYDSLALQKSPVMQPVKSSDFDDKIREIRAMARRARELEKNDRGDSGGEDNQVVNELSNAKEVIQQDGEEGVNCPKDLPNGYVRRVNSVEGILDSKCIDDPNGNDTGFSEVTLVENSERKNCVTLDIEFSNNSDSAKIIKNEKDDALSLSDNIKKSPSSEAPGTQSFEPKENSVKAKPRVMRSVKEAREYLSQKREKQEQNDESPISTSQVDTVVSCISRDKETNSDPRQVLGKNRNFGDLSVLSDTQNSISNTHACADYTLKRSKSIPFKVTEPEATEQVYDMIDHQIPGASLSHECSDSGTEKGKSLLKFPTDKEMEKQRDSESEKNEKGFQISDLDEKTDPTSAAIASGCSVLKAKDTVSTKNDDAEDVEEGIDHQMPVSSMDLGSSGRIANSEPLVHKENWMEKNYHEFEPVIKKIAVGFQDNYLVSREKVNQESNTDLDMMLPKFDEDDGELDWMKDDGLREIVFQVRENELMGRDPFHLMDAEDKQAFFEGLEKKVEKENKKLQNLHQWVHSNIENLDYGADGISLNDPPEKIIPRWKGPPVNASPEFLDDYLEQRKTLVSETLKSSYLEKTDEEISVQKSKESSPYEDTDTASAVYSQNKMHQDGNVKTPKTVIEGSDGSVRAGKKSGREYWEHTKKWSRGFLESYNAETDPEIKNVMKDIGKDLDRWITENEIQEAADLMDKLPERGRKLIQEKLNKVKREMELFGPQAVVSKYSEYAEEKEEDYLWWLDLPFVLCIELYTNQDGDQNIGFFSLEMAADLELDPKQYHVIAFEDAGDCKNLCYIIQAHMEMLGNGNAFVVTQPPKDAFREAKANGFGVTVIRKGELKLNVDLTLEEVEEQITEIGSKIYHDKIMKGRSVDISSLMKGVFGMRKPMKRKRLKRKLKKPTKH